MSDAYTMITDRLEILKQRRRHRIQRDQYRALWQLIHDYNRARILPDGTIDASPQAMTIREVMALSNISGTATMVLYLRHMRALGMIAFEDKLTRTIIALPEEDWR